MGKFLVCLSIHLYVFDLNSRKRQTRLVPRKPCHFVLLFDLFPHGISLQGSQETAPGGSMVSLLFLLVRPATPLHRLDSRNVWIPRSRKSCTVLDCASK
jgi:hypothetical protein